MAPPPERLATSYHREYLPPPPPLTARLAWLLTSRSAAGRQYIHEWAQHTDGHHQPQHVVDARGASPRLPKRSNSGGGGVSAEPAAAATPATPSNNINTTAATIPTDTRTRPTAL